MLRSGVCKLQRWVAADAVLDVQPLVRLSAQAQLQSALKQLPGKLLLAPAGRWQQGRSMERRAVLAAGWKQSHPKASQGQAGPTLPPAACVLLPCYGAAVRVTALGHAAKWKWERASP